MPAFFKDGRSVLFVHVPKTGGTTVERLFNASGWKTALRTTVKSNPYLHPVLRTSLQHLHGALLTELIDFKRIDLAFMMTREPIARFRSEYVMRHTEDPRADSATVEAWANRKLDRYPKRPHMLDNHIRPQTEFLVPGAQTYRLEDGMEAMVADLNDRFDLELSEDIPHIMHSTKRSGLSSADVQISNKLAARLRQFYAEDFANFGY